MMPLAYEARMFGPEVGRKGVLVWRKAVVSRNE